MKALIQQAQSGDPGARRQLVAALRPRLESMAGFYARRCGENYDDLLGEAWFAVFDALDITNITIGAPEQFLLKRARWRMLDYMKWARRRQCDGLESDDWAGQAEDFAGGVVEDGLVAKLLAVLSETQQTVLNGLLQGQTWREVAQGLGCSSANVAYHVRQIRRQCEELVA
jgi:RNA polymerase sigma-70 factor (ECF subfamily)